MDYDMTHGIIGQSSAAAASSLRCLLVSVALIRVLLSLRRSPLILSASAIDTIRGRPRQ
jgi:hypothetical protein